MEVKALALEHGTGGSPPPSRGWTPLFSPQGRLEGRAQQGLRKSLRSRIWLSPEGEHHRLIEFRRKWPTKGPGLWERHPSTQGFV